MGYPSITATRAIKRVCCRGRNNVIQASYNTIQTFVFDSYIYTIGVTKITSKLAAIELRKAGHSYSYIAQQLAVSKSTVSIWTSSVLYVPNKETKERIGKARAASTAVKSLQKQKSLESAKIEALSDLGLLSQRDLFLLGLGLYIGEGIKSDNIVRFVNAHSLTVAFMIRWFIEAVGVRNDNIWIRLHLYPDTDVDAAHTFWIKETGVPRVQFYSPVIDKRTDKKAKKRGKLPHGTAHVTVKSLGEKRFGVFLARKLMALSGLALAKPSRD